jgi:ribosomal-protein-alanine N-acetyltransferase
LSVLELSTPRTVVRMSTEADVPAIVDYFTRNREHLARWDPRRPPEFYTEAWWRERIAADLKIATEDRGYRFFAYDRSSSPGARARIVAMANYSNIVRGVFQSCHLGFGVDREHEGGGWMREVLVIGYSRDYLLIDGAWRDHVMTALINERWSPR